MEISGEVVQQLLEFRRARDWEQFHTAKNLASSLVIEASELLECFQWSRDDELAAIIRTGREHIEDELADVAILLTYLCVDMGVDLDAAVQRKIRRNAEKYPIEASRGKATKYDKL